MCGPDCLRQLSMAPLLQQTLRVGPYRNVSVEIGELLIPPEITSLLQQCDQVRCTVRAYKDRQRVACQGRGERRVCEPNMLTGCASGVIVLKCGYRALPLQT